MKVMLIINDKVVHNMDADLEDPQALIDMVHNMIVGQESKSEVNYNDSEEPYDMDDETNFEVVIGPEDSSCGCGCPNCKGNMNENAVEIEVDDDNEFTIDNKSDSSEVEVKVKDGDVEIEVDDEESEDEESEDEEMIKYTEVVFTRLNDGEPIRAIEGKENVLFVNDIEESENFIKFVFNDVVYKLPIAPDSIEGHLDLDVKYDDMETVLDFHIKEKEENMDYDAIISYDSKMNEE